MARNASGTGQPSECFTLSMAHPASAPTILGDLRVLVAVFVSVFAVSCRDLSFYLSCAYGRFVFIGHFVSNAILGYHLRVRKASLGSIDNAVCLDPSDVCKVRSGVFDPIDSDFSSNALISHLCLLRNPSTVFFRVITIVVFAVNRHSDGRLSHVANKISKAINPPVAHLYPATSVAGIVPIVRVKASLLHALPDCISKWNLFKWHKLSPLVSGTTVTVCAQRR